MGEGDNFNIGMAAFLGGGVLAYVSLYFLEKYD